MKTHTHGDLVGAMKTALDDVSASDSRAGSGTADTANV